MMKAHIMNVSDTGPSSNQQPKKRARYSCPAHAFLDAISKSAPDLAMINALVKKLDPFTYLSTTPGGSKVPLYHHILSTKPRFSTLLLEKIIQHDFDSERPVIDDFELATDCTKTINNESPFLQTSPLGSVCSLQGKRSYQEDRFCMETVTAHGKTLALRAIFDGHGGHHCADYLSKHIVPELQKRLNKQAEISYETISKAIHNFCADFKKNFFYAFVENFRLKHSGSTMILALETEKHIYTVNVGDSRAFICSPNASFALSRDQLPDSPDVRYQIQQDGGSIHLDHGVWRVDNRLAVGRAFGDAPIPGLSNTPDIYCVDKTHLPKKATLVLASDGLFQDATTKQMAKAISKSSADPQYLPLLAVQKAFTLGSTDNISVMISAIH